MYDIEKLDLVRITKQHLLKDDFFRPPSKTFWPTEASVKYQDPDGEPRQVGACHRATWYRVKGFEPTNPPTARGEFTFAMGKSIEEMLIEYWKQMGLWVANNIKWRWDAFNISGELDGVLYHPDVGHFIAEVKSFSGYAGEKQIMGTRTSPGRPKPENLMQAFLYAYMFREKNEFGNPETKGVKLVYLGRDKPKNFTAFNVIAVNQDNDWYPYVSSSNGSYVDKRMAMANIVSRYVELNTKTKMEVEPPREYVYRFDMPTLERRFQKGEISKTVFEKAQKSGVIESGDWTCSYCNYLSKCYQIERVEAESPEDE